MTEFAEHTSAAIAALDETALPRDVELTIEQQINDGEKLIDQFHVRLHAGTATVVTGAAPNPDVTIRQDVETARALRLGEIHAQRAFLTGRLSIDGDIDKLLRHGDLLSSLLRVSDA